MSCLEVPHVDVVVGLDLLLPKLSFNLPDFGLTLPCCNFELPPIPGFPIIIDIGALLNALLALSIDITPVLEAIQTAVDDLNLLLDQLTFDCPLNP